MEFFNFLDFSVTPFHTVEFLRSELDKSGFAPVNFEDSQSLVPGKAYYAVRGGALVAFWMPRNVVSTSKFRLALAHTDFPALKVTPNPDKSCAGVSTLHTEVYGSPLFTSWLDRDLGYAGLLAFEKSGKLETKLVRGEKLFRIPQLAVHLNRGVNQDGLKVNPQTDLDALWVGGEKSAKFVDSLQSLLAPDEKLLDFDVQLFDAQGANKGGMNDEWIYSGRLDNLSSCHAIAEALLKTEASENDFVVAAFFNNEEVGSTTREGAAGNFLQSLLRWMWNGAKLPQELLDVSLSESLALSIDMAHAMHPDFPQKHESNHAPILGEGIVLKSNAQKRYASDVLASARLKMLCESASVKLQTFIGRNDIPCGSTVGPTISARLGIPTVDIGEPMLSMHSIREMMAVSDHESMIRLVNGFFCA
ncbi:MAG: M18 family aminopeptidase [Fibrobacter sp.]|uniref:M18 family aminopeptidase n=1 Tax=Fibrobacter sp. TaxID=35828 RepID=UPI00388F28DD|nr:M18 family aminopeptidase [Fibrobacter sp.]